LGLVFGEYNPNYSNRFSAAFNPVYQPNFESRWVLSLTDTAFEKYSRYGISLLTHMDIYFQKAPLDVKRKMLGSIFPGKLIFQDGKYRTERMNPALMLILQKTSELQNEKTGNTVISENVSGDVHRTGLEPVTTRFEAGYSIRLSYRCRKTFQWEHYN
jgi:hypothetical protein